MPRYAGDLGSPVTPSNMPPDPMEFLDLRPGSSPAFVQADTDALRRGGSGCKSPALGCGRDGYTVAHGGYLRKGYDSGRWWDRQ